MKNVIKVLVATAVLSASVAYASSDSGRGFNAKLADEINIERGGFNDKGLVQGGFNDKGLERGGFNDKGLAKEVSPGWKKY